MVSPDPHGSRAQRVAYYDSLDMAGASPSELEGQLRFDDLLRDPCAVCGFEFDDASWRTRHTVDPSGEDCHASCCPTCRAVLGDNDYDERGPLDDDYDEAPRRARVNDPHTSKAGARDIALRAGTQKRKLLFAYELADDADDDGLTDEEAAAIAELPVRSCYWKRSSELRAAGLIAPTGETRTGVAGVPRLVCQITEAGRRASRGERVEA